MLGEDTVTKDDQKFSVEIKGKGPGRGLRGREHESKGRLDPKSNTARARSHTTLTTTHINRGLTLPSLGVNVVPDQGTPVLSLCREKRNGFRSRSEIRNHLSRVCLVH